jgi:hypothetical protein
MNICVAFDRDLDLVVILCLLFEKNQLELIACDSRASKKWESKRASVPFHIRCIRKDGELETRSHHPVVFLIPHLVMMGLAVSNIVSDYYLSLLISSPHPTNPQV